MAERPLLALPNPQAGNAPSGHGGASALRRPTDAEQVATSGPVFKRLPRDAGATFDGVMTLATIRRALRRIA